ncbi:MAG: hypothetical protein JXR56_08100, partial [Candidatus Cloacimonetes bacterium]|nr:hypothetical protein [Candidatus Cloacimonadota bacterium]
MKNKYRLVTLVVFTLLTISLFSIKNNRHYTLLQKETECWGVQDTGYGTIYNYDYSELGGNLVMSELGIQNWESVYFTIFYDPEYHYVVQYEMSTGNDGNTYVYTVLDSAQAIAFRYTYTINNQNKLAFYQYWKNGNYSYSTTKRLFYNPSGVLDSIFYSSHSYPNRSHYIKNIFAHDSLDRITTIQKFNSTDSLNWNPSYLRTVYYGIPLPFELHLNIPETSDSDPFEYLYCPDYRVDSLVTHYINDNYYVTESYSYSLSNNVLTIMFPEYIGEKVLQFNASGYLITNSNPGYPNSSGTYYTWGEYVVSNEDDY